MTTTHGRLPAVRSQSAKGPPMGAGRAGEPFAVV